MELWFSTYFKKYQKNGVKARAGHYEDLPIDHEQVFRLDGPLERMACVLLVRAEEIHNLFVDMGYLSENWYSITSDSNYREGEARARLAARAVKGFRKYRQIFWEKCVAEKAELSDVDSWEIVTTGSKTHLFLCPDTLIENLEGSDYRFAL